MVQSAESTLPSKVLLCLDPPSGAMKTRWAFGPSVPTTIPLNFSWQTMRHYLLRLYLRRNSVKYLKENCQDKTFWGRTYFILLLLSMTSEYISWDCFTEWAWFSFSSTERIADWHKNMAHEKLGLALYRVCEDVILPNQECAPLGRLSGLLRRNWSSCSRVLPFCALIFSPLCDHTVCPGLREEPKKALGNRWTVESIL